MENNEIDVAIKHLSKSDNILSTIIKKFDRCNLKTRSDYFNSLLESILNQQLSIKAGATIEKRFYDMFSPVTPEKVSKLTVDEIRKCGTSQPKARYILDLAEKTVSGELNFNGISSMPEEEIIVELTKVKGIGLWTAQMFLMFTLGKPDIVAYTDLGIKRAIKLNYGFDEYPDEKQVIELANKNNWHPYSTVACWYLWKTLD